MKRIIVFLSISLFAIIITAMDGNKKKKNYSYISLENYKKNKDIKVKTIYSEHSERNTLDLSKQAFNIIDTIDQLEVCYEGSTVYLTEVPRLILNLSHNYLVHLPKNIGNLQLIELNLSHNQLIDLPSELAKLNKLRVLNLCDNHIEQLPVDIGILHELKDLNVSGNKLTILPHSMSELKSLKCLNLSYNQLTELPDFFPQLERLSTLVLYGSGISQMPDSIGKLICQAQKHIYHKKN